MPAYVLFLLANAMLLIRPSELVPSLANVPLYLACIAGATLLTLPDLHNQLRWRGLMQRPVNLCVLGVALAIVSSRVTTGNFDGLLGSFTGMARILVYFLVLVTVITTPQRLRRFLMTTALCSSVMIAFSVYDYHHFNRYWMSRPDMVEVIYEQNSLPREERTLMRHIPDRDGVDPYGNEIFFFRLCGLGIFSDPNDLSLLIVATSFISIYFLTDPRLSAERFLWIIPLVVMAVAMHFTYSRGGLLAGGAAGMVWLLTRYGSRVAVAIGILGALSLPLALGRAANIDISDGTGQQRIQLWSDGLMAIRGGRVLFGIGEGRYLDVAGYVAHNSYLHAFVELGFFGGTFFFGCFFLPAYTFYLMKRHNFQIQDPELRRMFPYVAAILADWCMGMCSLSRCYVPSTYMVVGLCAAFINVAGYCRQQPRPLLVLNQRTAQPWIACSAAMLMGTYLFVRLFARWG